MSPGSPSHTKKKLPYNLAVSGLGDSELDVDLDPGRLQKDKDFALSMAQDIKKKTGDEALWEDDEEPGGFQMDVNPHLFDEFDLASDDSGSVASIGPERPERDVELARARASKVKEDARGKDLQDDDNEPSGSRLRDDTDRPDVPRESDAPEEPGAPQEPVPETPEPETPAPEEPDVLGAE